MNELSLFEMMARDKPAEKMTKQHREQQACARRLRQMQDRREKDAKRAARRVAKAMIAEDLETP